MNYPAPSRGEIHTGQATQIEQSRVIAEVEAAVVMAHRFPRDLVDVRKKLLIACQDSYLANRAFYEQKRTGGPVVGLTVHLARAMLSIYRNAQANVVELERDLARKQSQMMAYAWDLETNVRVSTTWIVEHRRDVRKQIEDIENLSGIYENNANQAARRLREQIVALLPPALVNAAVLECRKTIENGGGVPIEQRIVRAIEAFEGLGIEQSKLERRVGRPANRWIARDIAGLTVIYEGLSTGMTHEDEAFPPDEGEQPPVQLGRVIVARPPVTEEQTGKPPAGADVEQPPAEDHRPPEATARPARVEPITRKQSDRLFACFRDIGLEGRGDDVRRRRLDILAALVEHPLESQNHLTSSEAEMCATALSGWAARGRKEADVAVADLLAGWEARHRAPEPQTDEDDDAVPAEPTDDDGSDQ